MTEGETSFCLPSLEFQHFIERLVYDKYLTWVLLLLVKKFENVTILCRIE